MLITADNIIHVWVYQSLLYVSFGGVLEVVSGTIFRIFLVVEEAGDCLYGCSV